MSSDFYISHILPYAEIIIKICRAYTDTQEDFEDYYQEVCLQIWRTKDHFTGKAKWSTWIYRLSLNVCLTLLKKRKNNRQHTPHNRIDPDLIGAATKAVAEETAIEQLYQAIRQLSEIDRAIILLYLEEKSYREIAHIMGSNANNIGVRVSRIKTKLKTLMHGKVY